MYPGEIILSVCSLRFYHAVISRCRTAVWSISQNQLTGRDSISLYTILFQISKRSQTTDSCPIVRHTHTHSVKVVSGDLNEHL